MSKQSTDWADQLVADSDLPADEFTWTDGSNYGQDGFQFDQTMGEGVKNHGAPPGSTPGGIRDDAFGTVMGMSSLPDGSLANENEPEDVTFVDEDPLQIVDDGFNLTAMLEDSEVPLPENAREAASLADLAWLDPTQEQDPDRLPKELLPDRPPLDSSPELEDAWGVDRRTTGVHLVPSEDLDTARYNQEIRSPAPATPGTRAAADVFRAAVVRASQRSHFGYPLTKIGAELVHTLGTDPRLPTVMSLLASEHGLAGTVFVKASIFPGLKNGKWAKELKRKAKGARYVVTDNPVIAQKLGKQMVAEVPWAEALAHYRPMFAREGYKVASGDPRAVLRQAFLSGPQAKAVEASPKPIDMRPADTVTAADAFTAMAAAGPRELQVVASVEKRAEQAKRAAVLAQVDKWAAQGAVPAEVALKLKQSSAHPKDILRVVAKYVQAREVSDYGGQGVVASDGRQERITPKQAAAEVDPHRHVLRWARQRMSEGLMGQEFSALIQARWASPLLKVAGHKIQAARDEHEGLAGNLYVDAGAYASPAGVGGCEEGALRHRANQVKTVLAMSRCQACVHGGHGQCSIYNKPLIQSAAAVVPDVKGLQKKTLHMADASDAEVTASLFSPSEFSLQSPMSEDLELEDAPSTEALSVVFGSGMDLGE